MIRSYLAKRHMLLFLSCAIRFLFPRAFILQLPFCVILCRFSDSLTLPLLFFIMISVILVVTCSVLVSLVRSGTYYCGHLFCCVPSVWCGVVFIFTYSAFLIRICFPLAIYSVLFSLVWSGTYYWGCSSAFPSVWHGAVAHIHLSYFSSLLCWFQFS